ncbi:MAG: hypothetical protein SCARUB_04229 [Candidatus Scalindua rubra]|uniref:Nucleotidyl transferase AbiEii toxin, Type IV TA system n=1 Tax=Candidatus Scalindua rubra TaxID=1872076 RepID=A0A1E3X529_9BACT|nr:MAG: hypothetical protein SCARUB_04229 [Candidatus Scalindua rubra]
MKRVNFVDPIKFIELLNKEHVKYLLIGRQALVQYGAPLQSFDYDFYIAPELENLKKIIKIAHKFKMEIVPPDPQKALKLTLHADNLKVDVCRARKYPIKGGTLFFEEMYENRTVFRKGKFKVDVPSLIDLKKTKLTRNTAKDREDLKYIDELISRLN